MQPVLLKIWNIGTIVDDDYDGGDDDDNDDDGFVIYLLMFVSLPVGICILNHPLYSTFSINLGNHLSYILLLLLLLLLNYYYYYYYYYYYSG